MNPRATPRFTRFTVLAILFTLFASFLPMVQITEALSIVGRASLEVGANPGGGLSEIRSVSSVETRYDLVVILVEENVWNASSSGSGFFSFLGVTSLAEKIQTYAQDVQAALPWTKSVIMTVSANDTPVEIQHTLEKLYFEGDETDSDATKLAGVVVVGDVPLPVVNKNGYRFVSLLPYTDFEEPAYVVEEPTQDFVPNLSSENLQAEVWHGVLVPPADGQAGMDLLAAYFDKNHAFHTGDPEYTTFDQKSFIGDFVTESHTLNSVAYGAYDRYTSLWEDLAYYRYTNDLVEEVFTKMQDSVKAGDLLDNDLDGAYDEEASNSMDDDGDGLVDEDLGDGFYGIDNDSDGSVDEDGSTDNNNDKDWVIDLYRTVDSPVFEDNLVDEDPPGDTTGGEDLDEDGYPDGDGCPGYCGKDDNGDAEDHDGDGFPTGFEIVLGTDFADERDPWRSVLTISNASPFNFNFGTADEATAYWKRAFTDQFFGGDYKSNTCYASDGTYHPEWDDDEDGFCDEDGSTEDRLWENQNGTPYSGSCAYNDADCDGSIDEDTVGIQPVGLFDGLPDLQAKKLIEGLTKKYVELFDEPQGVWNRLVGGSGRYKTQSFAIDGTPETDYDTAISLISKKDEYALQYLRTVNDAFESKVNALVNDDLSIQIPIIGLMELSGVYTIYEENEDGDTVESEAQDICEVGQEAKLDNGSCLQFLNSSSNDGLFNALPYNSFERYVFWDAAGAVFMNGKHLWEVDSPKQCTLFAGTEEEGGQLSQFNTMYSTDQLDLSSSEVKEYKNCIPEYAPYLKDIPELCSVATTTQDIHSLGGAISADEIAKRIGKTVEEATAGWEVGPEACYEFREFSTYANYLTSNGGFNDWLSKKIRKFQKDTGRDENSYEEFLTNVEAERGNYSPRPDEAALRKDFNELDLVSSSEDITYTVVDMMKDLGFENSSDEDIDTFLALHDEDTPIVIENPQYGAGTEDLVTLTVYLNKAYLKEESESFTLDEEEAELIPSVYYHTEPNIATLNAQAGTLASPNLPIDATRRVVFIDSEDQDQTLNFVNVFDASNISDIEAQLETLSASVGDVAGGASYVDDVKGFLDDFNTQQLEDALAWYRMSIDEKHQYVLSHYLGAEEPITSKARNGYEVVTLIADGTATEMMAGFYPVTNPEEDAEWLYPNPADQLAALLGEAPEDSSEPLTDLSNTTPVELSKWFPAVQSWLEDLRKNVTNFGDYGGDTTCGDASDFSALNVDADGSGIPDGAETTASLLLSSEDYNVLEAGNPNSDSYVVSVSAEGADGSLNASDSYTEVSLEIVSGEASIEVLGPSVLTLSGGVATFSLSALAEGSFTVKATAINRSNITESNSLSGTVENKKLLVTTFVREQVDGGALDTYLGNRIEVRNELGDIVATLDPETGALNLRGAEAKLVEATPELPTRIRIQSPEGKFYGVFFLIPETKTVAIGDGYDGVFVKLVDGSYSISSIENGLGLFKDAQQIGLVTEEGQISVSEGYRIAFSNPSEINVYDPIRIVDSRNSTLFTVTIKHPVSEGSLLEPSGSYENYLSFFPALWMQRAVAAVTIPDQDSDGLDDLEELVLGTDFAASDTDMDSYADGTEVFSGYDPLRKNEKLFTDIDASDPAYYALATLVLRGIVKGYPDGSFKPENPITREEFVKIDLGSICKDCDSYDASYEESLMDLYSEDPFPDVDINSELLACVAEAKTLGIVSGYGSGEELGYFLPTRNISRAEATKVLVETGDFEARIPRSDEAWYAGYVDAAETYGLFPEDAEITQAWLEGSITRGEFVQMAVNLVQAKDCRAVDTDSEGLSDTEETVLYGTDPKNPDSDFGGVTDFDEVLRGSDPLDASDDFLDAETGSEPVGESDSSVEDYSAYGSFDHEPGLFSVSSTANYESIATPDEDGLDTMNVYTTEVPADGESSLYVRAEIRDIEDKIYTEDSSSIVEFVLSSSEYGVLDNALIQVRNGVAETYFTASQTAGELTVDAQLRDGGLPSEGETVRVYPGEAAAVDLDLESSVLPAGGQSVTNGTLRVYDRFGNLASYGSTSVTLDSESLDLLDLSDNDAETPGYQVTVSDGELSFRVLSETKAGAGIVTAILTQQPDISDAVSLYSVKGLALALQVSSPYLFAGTGSTETLGVAIVDSDGVLQTGFNGEVSLSTSDPNYGSFDSQLIDISEGSGMATLTVGTLAGTGSILAESPGLEVGSTALVVKPSEVHELRIRKTDGATKVQAGTVERFVVEAYDAYGNLVNTDSSTQGTLRLTDATEQFGTLSSSSFVLNQGSAAFSVTVGKVSGVLNVVASSTNLISGVWGGDIDYFTSGEDLQSMEPQMLYANVLGAPFGDVRQENYVAGWLLFNGKTQAVSSLVSESNPHKPLGSVDSQGNILLSEDGLLTQAVQSAGTGLPVRIQWRSFPDEKLKAELFFVDPAEGSSTATLLTTDSSYELTQEEGESLLLKDSAVLARVREDGQIVLLDPSLYLTVNSAGSGLNLLVMANSQAVMSVNYTAAWNKDVSLVSSDFDMSKWKTLDSGIYIKASPDSEHSFEPVASGNSSLTPSGLAFVDVTQTLAQEMRPSMGYTSLDSAEENGNVGWEQENKNMLLFSAGNTAGASNLFYASEVGVLLGDPTIKIQTPNEVNDLGYTEDVGSLLSASQGEILDLVDIDYNADGQMDVLLAYKDGRIDLLQNYEAAVRLRSRGTLLTVENGIRSIDKGDFNSDGLTDLLIVTEEACYAGEMCLYEYDNIGGGFVAKNLSFPDITAQPDQVEVSDLNQDGYEDLVIADENMVLYTVWNQAGTLSIVDKIKDFGLQTDSSMDLSSQVLLHYSGLSDGAVSLATVQASSSTNNSELDGFISSLNTLTTFTVTTDGQAAGSLSTRESTPFDYSNSEEFADVIAVEKSVFDEDGGRAELGDALNYTVQIQNVSGTTLKEVYVSDTLDAYFDFDSESFACSDCESVDLSDASLEVGDDTRPFVYGPFDLSNGAKFEFTYSAQVRELPQLSLMVGNDLFGDYVDDDYPDIGVSLEGNTSGELIVYYSDGIYKEILTEGIFGSSFGAETLEYVNYEEKLYSPENSTYADEYDSTTASPFEDANADGIPDFVADMDPSLGFPVPTGYDPFSEVLGGDDEDNNGYYSSQEMFSSNKDDDGDGLYNTIDSFNAGNNLLLDPSLDIIAEDGTLELDGEVAILDEQISGLINKVESIVSTFTCDGGCLALPGSVAFLAPGRFHNPLTGTPLTRDLGFPVFGIMPNPSFVCAGTACQATSIFRLYLAPTTTLGLGLGVCVAPYAVGQCYAFNIPILQASGVCDAINGFIADSLSKASAFVEEKGSIAINVGGSGDSTQEAADSGLKSSSFSSYKPPVSFNKNIDLPGFPSIFTEWWKAQKMEFFKMLDLPDITIIYPDPKSMASEFTGIRQKALENQASNAVDLDQSLKIQEMQSGIFSLEKILNAVHALPLIDIKTEKVTIYYPWVTKEERELVAKDWKQWLVDTKTGFAEFKKQFELKRIAGEELSEAKQAAFEELVSTVDGVITSIETNMAVLESYAEIPEQILEIRGLGAEYAKVIICYLDAILDYTAGYLNENLERIQAWAQWVVDLRKIVDGWQLLIDLSADLMDSCDKCTNQRFSGIQLLLSLFVYMPDFPVIELPKLPDIVLDVSHIQAGIDIVWPDIQFVPERINIPNLPRIVFPSAEFDLNLDLNLDVQIPILPSFDFNIEFPQLPPLTLPELPSLPPPPKVPELDPTLKASLEVASSVLKLVCLIRSGFIPTPESQLKTRIEEITERAGGVLLPADLAVTVEWPSFGLDFLKRIEITTYLNLTGDFTVLFDVIESFGEKSQDISQDVANSISDPLEKLAQDIQSILKSTAESLSIEAEADVELDIDANSNDEQTYLGNPAAEVAKLYSTDPLVVQRLSALKNVMTTLQTQVDEWSATLPENVQLTATDRVLALDDPLLHRYDEIVNEAPLDAEFLASIEDTPLVGVLGLKTSLLSYVQDLEAENTRLLAMDPDEFFTELAQNTSSSAFQVAGTESDEGYSTAAEWNLEALQVPSLDETDQTVELSSEESEFEGLNFGQEAEAFNTGLYIYNPELDVSTRLTAYAAEADETTHILFMDFDGDEDQDVVYSLGGDVYLKENYTESPKLRYVSTDPSELSLSDFAPEQGSVHNLKESDNNYQESSFSFDASSEAVGYEFLMYDSLDAQEAAPSENVKRLLLLSDESNAVVDLDTVGRDFDAESSGTAPLPKLEISRLVASDKNGKVSLKNAARRTLIQENGELSTSSPVVLQTLEASTVEITYPEGNATLTVPAYTVLRFGSGSGRTIRLDRGTAYMIDETEIVDSQDLGENMMVLPEEMVDLEGSTSQVTLTVFEGGALNLNQEEFFVMDRLSNAQSPYSQVALENGAYYMVARAMYTDGTFGTLSDNVLLNPQICGDDAEPVVVVDGGDDNDNDGTLDLAIFSTMELSADQSFDSDSEIIDAYWDMDSAVDADGDGDFVDDAETIGLTAQIGPYDNTDPKTVTVHIVDSAGNIASESILVNIYVPDIQITDVSITEVSGLTDPLSPSFPFTLVRDRNGAWQELKDGSTDDEGNFTLPIEDSDLLVVYNADAAVVAKFNPKTKQIKILDEDYAVSVLAATAEWPARLVVYEKLTGLVMGSFIFVTDSSLPITRLSAPLSEYDLSTFNRVAVHSLADPNGYEFGQSSVTSHDELGNLDLMISNDGNFTVFDDRYTVLRRESESLDEHLILEVYDEGKLELELWPGSSSEVHIENTDSLNLPASDLINGESLASDTRYYFEDLSSQDALYGKISELVERGILEGYDQEGRRYFRPENSITRAEFTKIILSILCIVPREEASLLPSVFNDILDPSPWYYPYTKESYLSGLITGYLGEIDASGLTPFKPDNSITRAEATKIVLEALEKEGIITLSGVSTTGAWYEPYMEIAQDLTPYMTEENTAGDSQFILTAEEAADPMHVLTRYEFVQMSVRVLQAYNCFELDSDGDGLINYDEENKYGSDPYNPDTDAGGITDGLEVGRGSDPLLDADDFEDGSLGSVEPGIYAIQEACSTCPCVAQVDFEAELRPGDSVFAIIQNELGEIFGISDSVTVSDPHAP